MDPPLPRPSPATQKMAQDPPDTITLKEELENLRIWLSAELEKNAKVSVGDVYLTGTLNGYCTTLCMETSYTVLSITSSCADMLAAYNNPFYTQ